jgi:hypothetical protein
VRNPGGNITRIEGEGFELLLSWQGDYLRAQVNGEHDDYAISLGYWSEVARACEERGAKQVLVVENLQQTGQEVDLERLVDAIVALGFRDVRVAFVDLIDSHLKAMEHGEILARERGIVGRVFGREDEAERWLRYGAH